VFDMYTTAAMYYLLTKRVCCHCRQPNRERLEFASVMLDEILDSADKPFDVNSVCACVVLC